MPKPMLALPMGKDDWEKGQRWQFLLSCQPILERLGWTIGVEAKGSLGDWAVECFGAISQLDGRVTWHWPIGATKKLHQEVSDDLKRMAEETVRFKSFGLEAVTIHCAPAVLIDPPEDAGLERYNSPISAEEMLACLKAQVEPLKQLNEWTGGILQIENVDITNFRDGGYRVPTYLALQAGCWLDLVWLKQQSGVQTTFDSEHFLCSGNLLTRARDFINLPSVVQPSAGEAEARLADLAGYHLRKGWPPTVARNPGFEGYVKTISPQLFHLGGAKQAVDSHGRIATHQPYDLVNDRFQKVGLDYLLKWIMGHPETSIGGVIEVTGQWQPDMYSEWSPRPHDDEVAKMMTYLTVINEIESIQKEG